ncbi:MAG TPA: MBL fold metallo-hydrolase [Chitinophagales bacterium]
MLTIKKFTFNPFQENSYIIGNEAKEALLIDPGCHNAYEQEQFLDYIKNNDLKPVRLLNTHCHIDHIPGNPLVARTFGLPLEIHELELENLNRASTYGSMFGFNIEDQPEPQMTLHDGAQFTFGDTLFSVIHTPGHSVGSVCFYFPKEAVIISGDVLFKGSVGRYDLPGSNGEDLYNSITTKMMKLPDDVSVYSGHGMKTTIGEERKSNPFLNRDFFFGM